MWLSRSLDLYLLDYKTAGGGTLQAHTKTFTTWHNTSQNMFVDILVTKNAVELYN